MDKHQILERTQAAFKYVQSLGYRPVYIGLYGSQNYGLDVNEKDYQSDLDWKCLILPTLADLIQNSKPVSTVLEFDGGQIDLKDVRAFTDSVVKCNVNFIEILTTNYFYCTNDSVLELRKQVVPLMKEMWFLYLKACFGMMKEKEAALRHPYPKTKHRVDQFGYDPKQLHHIARLKILIERYVACSKKDFIWNVANFAHYGNEQEQLVALKKWLLTNEEVDENVKFLLEKATEAIQDFKRPMVFTAKARTIQLARDLILNEIIKWIKENSSWLNSSTPVSQNDSVNTAETQ